jgi:ketosteroid isomerase-like protein
MSESGGGVPGPAEVAERLFRAIEAGDIDAVASLYSPDILVWHNTDGKEQSLDENLETLRWVIGHIADRRYTDVRRSLTNEGFAQQHVLRGTGPNGDIAMPAALFATVQHGQITRIDEYLDSAQVAMLTRRPPAQQPA